MTRPLDFLIRRLFLFRTEIVLAHATEGAHPILGKVLKRCSGLDAAVGVAYFWVIDITASVAYILFHFLRYYNVNK